MKTHKLITTLLTVICSLSLTLMVFAAPAAYEQNRPDGTTAGTLRVWATSQVSPVLEDLADDLWAAYQVDLVVEVVNSTYDEFISAIGSGTGPDITYVPHDRIGSLAHDNYIVPIDLGTNSTQFLASSIEACTISGLLYCMPWAVESLGLFYNTTLVPTPPTTWSQVQSTGEALITNGDVLYGLSLAGTTYDAYPLMTAYGGYVFGKDLNGDWNPDDLGIDSPGMIAAVDWLADRVSDGFLSSSTDWANAHWLFETGQIPFLMAGPWALDHIRSSGVPYAIADFPSHTDPGIPFLGVQGFVINAASINIDMARTFLMEFIATESTMTALAQASKRPPAYLPAIANITDPDMLALAEIASSGSPMPNIPEMGLVWGPWSNAVTVALEGTLTAEQALTAAADEIRAAAFLLGMVNVPGSYQSLVGCDYDWQPGCARTAMTEIEEHLWASGPFVLPPGSYECKVALDGGWAVNYGLGGVLDGANIPFTLVQNEGVSFVWDEETKILNINKVNILFLPSILR